MFMKNKRPITFNLTGYDPFIDFLKTYSILVVVFCHGFPYLKEIGYTIWGVQIPLFFLIQVFHCYKRDPKPINWKMIGKRIVMPFIMIELLVFGVLYLIWGGQNVSLLVKTGVVGGGYGPGSYYPWVYLQMAILIPLMRPICERLENRKSFLFFLLLSIAMEIICSITKLSNSVYRLLCFRYIFLIWLGWIWVKVGIKLNALTIAASFFSFAAIIYFAYFRVDFEPLFYNTGWKTHRWICYFWVSFAFIGILHWFYTKVFNNDSINKIVKAIASASFEIFLVQMAYYKLIPIHSLDFLQIKGLQFCIWILCAFVVSIMGGIGLYRFEKSMVK